MENNWMASGPVCQFCEALSSCLRYWQSASTLDCSHRAAGISAPQKRARFPKLEKRLLPSPAKTEQGCSASPRALAFTARTAVSKTQGHRCQESAILAPLLLFKRWVGLG
eukprot:776899-Amphidinium_carterae.1